MREHFRITSIPPRTMLATLREQKGRRESTQSEKGFSVISVNIGSVPPREPRQGNLEQDPQEFNVKRHVFQKPTREREDERITWQVEIIEDYNNARDLGLIMRFSGISFKNTPVFERSRHDYGPDSRVFYFPVGYKNGQAVLIFATFGDIFESQVVPRKKDVNPFFREEIYYKPLLTLYDPASMRPSYNNGLFIVNYNRKTG